MNKPSEDHQAWPFLSGGGEMGELTRTYNWSDSDLGNPTHWPQSLKLTLSMILSSSFPMFVWWGNDLIQFYNDAFRPILGTEGKHPMALGQKAIDCWPESWNTISPLIEKVINKAEATYSEDQLIPIYRNGKIEDVYWTFSYSPIFSEKMKVEGVLAVCADTTAKVKAKQALEESEQRFRLLAESADILIGTNNENGKLDYFNKAWVEFTGRPMHVLIESGWRDLLHPEDSERFDTAYKAASENRKVLEIEVRLLNKNNEYRWLLAKIPPRFNKEGVFKGYVSTCVDITDRKKAGEQLIESEERLRSIVENAPFPIGVYVGREMKIVLANKAIMDVWGRGYNIIGKTYFEILPELENQDVYQKLLNVFDSGIPFHGKNQRIILKIGDEMKVHYFNYSFTPLYDVEGNIYGVMNTGVDITDINLANQKIKENEKHLHETILKAPVAICILKGKEYKVELANDKMLELWGVKAKDVLNVPIFEAIPVAKNQGLEERLYKVITTGQTVSAENVPLNLPRNGTIEKLYLDFVYQANLTRHGKVSNIMAIATDVTPQVKMRQKIEEVVGIRTKELADANKSLQKSNAELAQFAHIASHDLQEPLRKITIFTEMLEDKIGHMMENESVNYLDKIRTSSSRMHSMIKDILTYSELLNQVKAFKRTDLNEIVEKTLTDYELLVEQKGAQINCDNLPVIKAIPMQMTQLFGNLIGNSLKFTNKNRNLILSINSTEIDLKEKEKNGLDINIQYLKISFTDNGIGFPEEFKDQIFNIFNRLHNKSDYSGTGIGLAICKRIVQNHLGVINAEGSSEGGAVFNVILPFSMQEN